MAKIKNTLTPKEKLLKAIFGTTKPTQEQIEKAEEEMYERQAASVTDEEFKKIWGVSIEEHTNKMMLYAGWCDAVAKWNIDHGKDKKYVVSDSKPQFTFGQVVDMVQLFYRQGQEDAKNEVVEYDRLYKLNKE